MLGSSIQSTSPNTLASTSLYDVADDILFSLGDDKDQVLLNRSAVLNANTALTSVLVGTPIAKALDANSLIISNVTASGDMAFYGNLGGNSQQFLFYDTSASMLYLSYVAGAYSTAANFGRVNIGSTGAIVVTTATVPILASLILNEPNITISTGAVTLAATLYIAGAPTEGGAFNDAIHVASGASTFWGHIGLMTGPSLITSLYCAEAKTIDSDTAQGFTGLQFDTTVNKTTQAWTQDSFVRGVTGSARVGASNTQNWTMPLGVRGVASAILIQAGATGTITGGVNYYASATISAATLTNRYGLYVLDATGAGTITNQYGVYFEALTKGTTLNYMIHGATNITFGMGINIAATKTYQVDGTQVVGARVIDARCDDTVGSGDATTDGVIDALRDAMITHGLIAAA